MFFWIFLLLILFISTVTLAKIIYHAFDLMAKLLLIVLLVLIVLFVFLTIGGYI